MKTIFLSLFLMAMIYTSGVHAQVRLNVNLHPVSEMTLAQDLNCVKQNRDLLVSFELKTFMARTDSFLRLEILDLDESKNYLLSYNKIQKSLMKDRPYHLVPILHGSQTHKISLLIRHTPLSYCETIQDALLVSVEPM